METLFEAIDAQLMALEGVRSQAWKTQVSYYARRAFAAVSRGPRKGTVRLSLAMRRPIDDPRVFASVEVRPGRFTVHVDMREPDEFDAVVRDWLMEAYATSGIA